MPELSPNLRLALEACKTCAGVTPNGDIWFGAISKEYKAKGVTRHDLESLESLGHLIRTGKDRYELANAQRKPPLALEKLTKIIEAREQLDAVPTDDPPESKWQEVTWSDIGKRLLLKGVVAFGTILVEATLEEVFSRTHEDANGRKHDKKTGRFTK